MRAAVCEELGKLRLTDLPDPEAGPGQIVVAVEAAGVNFVDGLIVGGKYQIKPELPFVPGAEVAGTVIATGPGVDGPAPGTRVLATSFFGGFAERAAVPAPAVVPVPDAVPTAVAATFVQSYSTGLFALRDRARMAAGEGVLVLGAGGGVGLAAVQIAKALGGRVLAAASTEAKREAARAAGADETIDASGDAETVWPTIQARAREFGTDISYDPVGGALSKAALRGLREGGRHLVIGFASGTIPHLPTNQMLLRNRSVVGVDWGSWSMANPEAQRAALTELLSWVEDGRLTPVAPSTRPLSEAPAALADLAARRVVGKIALLP